MTENLATIGETPARTLQHRQMYIDGDWVDAVSGQTFEPVNPYTGKAWATAPLAGAAVQT